MFQTPLAETIFFTKYAIDKTDTWAALSKRVASRVTREYLTPEEVGEIGHSIERFQFIPAGRYLYYSGQEANFWNNCFCLDCEEDTREEWSSLMSRASSCLMSGGGIGVDYSRIRPEGSRLRRTGGIASGPIPLMQIINEIGRNVMQGGSRRSAVWAGLNWKHGDISKFLVAKNWSKEIRELKAKDFNFPAPLDMTNISIQWDDSIFRGTDFKNLWDESVLRMCKTGEPGHSYNFFSQSNERLRNACTEFISDTDSDVCNLGSVNMAQIESLDEFREVVRLASMFLVCGSIGAELPYEKVYKVRQANRKIGLGLMGIHEWLLRRGYGYNFNPELKEWLNVYKVESERAALRTCSTLSISPTTRHRAIAPAGTIGILASTTTGIEPLFSTAYKRRVLQAGTNWNEHYTVDPIALRLVELGISEDKIETALHLARDPERRIKFQAEVQQYVDMGISSTINLPPWGSVYNNKDTAKRLADTLLHYCPGLRGITCYPDGARSGQPLEAVSIKEAKKHGAVFEENEETCKGGVCGI